MVDDLKDTDFSKEQYFESQIKIIWNRGLSNTQPFGRERFWIRTLSSSYIYTLPYPAEYNEVVAVNKIVEEPICSR